MNSHRTSDMETYDAKTSSDRGKTCLDYFGNFHPHGAYFKPPYSICSECLCNNGLTTKCISMQCPKPTCEGYKRMPGKCCDYVCPDYQTTDATTLAILITLSIALLLIIVAIVVVWRKMRRKKLFGKRLDSISTSSNQDTDTDTMIEHNSIPNNKRHQLIFNSPKNAPSTFIPANENTSNLISKTQYTKHYAPNSSAKFIGSKQNNINVNKKTIYSKVSSSDTDGSSTSSCSKTSSINRSDVNLMSDVNSTPLLQNKTELTYSLNNHDPKNTSTYL